MGWLRAAQMHSGFSNCAEKAVLAVCEDGFMITSASKFEAEVFLSSMKQSRASSAGPMVGFGLLPAFLVTF